MSKTKKYKYEQLQAIEKKESRKNLAYLPEKFQPSSSLKGKEFLSLFSGDLNAKFEKSKIEKAAKLLSLETEALNRSVGEYSKGKVLIIEVDDLDFAENEEDLGSIIEKIDAEINGLFK